MRIQPTPAARARRPALAGGRITRAFAAFLLALAALAAAAVARFDRFRVPSEPAELARRRAQRLTARQEALLQRWGYPHVMEEFRFHMTLTGALPEADLAAVEAALASVLAPLLPAPFIVDALTLLGADGEGRFHQIARVPLTG